MKLNPQVHAGRFGGMFWACFSRFGVGTRFVVEGTIDTKQYIEICLGHFLPEIKATERQYGADRMFMLDKALCHKANSVKAFFQHPGVASLPSSAQFPFSVASKTCGKIPRVADEKKIGKLDPSSKSLRLGYDRARIGGNLVLWDVRVAHSGD
jgi:hypothetical protein